MSVARRLVLIGLMTATALGLPFAAGAAALPPATEPPAPIVTESHPASAAVTASEQSSDDSSVLAPAIVDGPVNPRRTHWFVRTSLGFAYRWAFDESLLGAALLGELGAQAEQLSGGIRLRFEIGSMRVGLPYQVITVGPFLWLPQLHKRVHLGLGIDTGVLLISRRTMPFRSMWSMLWGGQLGATIDLLKVGETGAIHLEGSVGCYALTAAPGPLSVISTVSIGYRP